MSRCTSGGGIPLGVKITECEEVITEAITFLKAIYYQQMHYMEEELKAQKYA